MDERDDYSADGSDENQGDNEMVGFNMNKFIFRTFLMKSLRRTVRLLPVVLVLIVFELRQRSASPLALWQSTRRPEFSVLVPSRFLRTPLWWSRHSLERVTPTSLLSVSWMNAAFHSSYAATSLMASMRTGSCLNSPIELFGDLVIFHRFFVSCIRHQDASILLVLGAYWLVLVSDFFCSPDENDFIDHL